MNLLRIQNYLLLKRLCVQELVGKRPTTLLEYLQLTIGSSKLPNSLLLQNKQDCILRYSPAAKLARDIAKDTLARLTKAC